MIPEDNSLAREGFDRSYGAGWNGRLARCCRRLTGSASHSEAER